MGKKKKGKKKPGIDPFEEEYKKAPHSFVFQRGQVGKNVKQLMQDTRMVMEPFTAKRLQTRKKNSLKDFVSVAGVLNVSHFMVFTKTEISVNMKLCRLPRGPTLTFRVHNYSLSSDVVSSLKKPMLEHVQYLHHPLLVMNNFSGEEKHIKLMATMFQNLFPSINVHKVKLSDVRRCVLVNYDSDTKLLDFRHYNIRVVPVGMSRKVKKLAVQAKVPDLSKFKDISDYIYRMGYSSESEAELDGPANEVILPQKIHSRGNMKSSKSAVRLTELGPRMTLQLVKIEEGIFTGEVMYHAFINKTDEELKAMEVMRRKKEQLKEARKKEQEQNIKKKKEKLEEHKQKSLAGVKRKAEEEKDEDEIENPMMGTGSGDSEDDDIEYYKQAVGLQPDTDTYLQGGTKKKKFSPSPRKKQKTGNKPNSDDKPLKTNDKKQKFNKKGRRDVKSDKQNKGVKDKQNKDRDRETRKKKGKIAGMTIEQRLKLKKKKKMKMKEKKLPKHKRKLVT